MRKNVTTLLMIGVIAAAMGCEAVRAGMEGHEAVVARAAGFTLTVDHAADLLSSASPEVAPAVPEVGYPITEMWINYTILALELASADSFDNLDLTPLIQLSSGQELVWNLHRNAILDRAEPSESELRESYERDRPLDRIEVYQILIRIPREATSTQQDSLRRHAESIWDRLVAGEDFEEMARTYSEDPTSAANGGRLGWYGRGRLVPEMESVIFSLEPGHFTEPMGSGFGYHIWRVADRDSPDFDSVRETYRNNVLDERVPELEGTYIDSLFEAAELSFAPGAERLTNQIAASSRMGMLSPAERSAVLVRYKGGTLTAGELADFIIRRRGNTRAMFASSDSARTRELLLEIMRNELLVRAARTQGYNLTDSQTDSLLGGARRELHTAAALAGFLRSDLLAGDSVIAASVDRVIREVLARQRSPEPLQRVSPALRGLHKVQVHHSRFPEVAVRLTELREAEAIGADAAVQAEEPETRAAPDTSDESR